MSTIEFVHVSKRFDATTAVADISFSIAKGELVTFLGPSGCGKTTCLRLIAGLDLPSSGRVLVGGRDVSGDRAFARNIGMVFQSYALFPHMSVLDNAAYSLVMRGVKKRQAQEKALEILSQVGLDGLDFVTGRPPGSFPPPFWAVVWNTLSMPEVRNFWFLGRLPNPALPKEGWSVLKFSPMI